MVQARHPIRFSSQMDRVRCKPWGLFGGLSAFGNSVALHRFSKTEETHFPNGKALNQVLQPGDAYILRSGGGGGYRLAARSRSGGAGARCALRLREPRGCRERSTARCSRAKRFRLDRAATERRRAQMREQGLPHDQPITEVIIPFPAATQPPERNPEHDKLSEEERVAFAMQCRCCS